MQFRSKKAALKRLPDAPIATQIAILNKAVSDVNLKPWPQGILQLLQNHCAKCAWVMVSSVLSASCTSSWPFTSDLTPMPHYLNILVHNYLLHCSVFTLLMVECFYLSAIQLGWSFGNCRVKPRWPSSAALIPITRVGILICKDWEGLACLCPDMCCSIKQFAFMQLLHQTRAYFFQRTWSESVVAWLWDTISWCIYVSLINFSFVSAFCDSLQNTYYKVPQYEFET
jgi:hypothetical protein